MDEQGMNPGLPHPWEVLQVLHCISYLFLMFQLTEETGTEEMVYLLQPVWQPIMNFFAVLVICCLFKKIIKINNAAILKFVTELVTRPRFSKAISFVYVFIFLQLEKIQGTRLVSFKNAQCLIWKEDPSCATLPLMAMRVKSPIFLQQGRLEHIVNMISVYILSSPRVSHQQQLQNLLLCHFYSADKNTWHFEKV